MVTAIFDDTFVGVLNKQGYYELFKLIVDGIARTFVEKHYDSVVQGMGTEKIIELVRERMAVLVTEKMMRGLAQ